MHDKDTVGEVIQERLERNGPFISRDDLGTPREENETQEKSEFERTSMAIIKAINAFANSNRGENDVQTLMSEIETQLRDYGNKLLPLEYSTGEKSLALLVPLQREKALSLDERYQRAAALIADKTLAFIRSHKVDEKGYVDLRPALLGFVERQMRASGLRLLSVHTAHKK